MGETDPPGYAEKITFGTIFWWYQACLGPTADGREITKNMGTNQPRRHKSISITKKLGTNPKVVPKIQKITKKTVPPQLATPSGKKAETSHKKLVLTNYWVVKLKLDLALKM